MVKNLPAMQETRVGNLDWEDPPGEGSGSSLQYSCLENSMDRGAQQAIVLGDAELDMTERLTHIHTQSLKQFDPLTCRVPSFSNFICVIYITKCQTLKPSFHLGLPMVPLQQFFPHPRRQVPNPQVTDHYLSMSCQEMDHTSGGQWQVSKRTLLCLQQLPNIYYHLSSASCQISVGIINVRGLCCYRALALSTLCHIANSHWLSISHV